MTLKHSLNSSPDTTTRPVILVFVSERADGPKSPDSDDARAELQAVAEALRHDLPNAESLPKLPRRLMPTRDQAKNA